MKLKLKDTAQTYAERVFKITIDDPSDMANLWIVDCNQIGEVFFQASYPLAIPQNWTNTTNKEED